MATRPPIGMPKLSRRSRMLLIIAASVIVLLLVGARLLDKYVDWLWYGEVGFRGVFSTVLLTQIALFFAAAILVGGTLAVSLIVAYRTRPVFVPVSGVDDPLARYRAAIVARIRLFGIGLPVVAGFIAGLAAQSDWQIVQLMFNSVPFGITDPEFGHDISFYVFKLPFWSWLIGWMFVTIVIAFIGAAVTHYLFGGIRLAGKGGQLSAPARVQLSVIAGLFVLVYAVDYLVERYELLSKHGNMGNLAGGFTGATYTDLNAVLPAKLILMIIAVFCALAFFAGAFLRNLQLPAIAIVLLLLSGVLIGVAWPQILQQFSVKPNENEKESKAITRNLEATRYAFGITKDKVDIKDYPGVTTATSQEIRDDKGTVPNVRLLDPSILEKTFTNREARENVYGFQTKLDVDRYVVNGKLQDYIVAAREINEGGLTENQRSWINQHMVYTHGNGLVAAPANTIKGGLSDKEGQGGYPEFTVSDLDAQKAGNMKIPVHEPRIYFGELATDYAIVGGSKENPQGEYDGQGKPDFRYNGKGGVPVNGLFNRLVFAAYNSERNILFNSAIGDGSRIMYNRDPKTRVTMAAPWLTVDNDPYPAAINGRIQWVVDGYTTLEKFPYAQRTPFGQVTTDSLSGATRQDDRFISYIRNSVKATVDAYDGTVTLYEIDDQDPVLKAWKGVFPGSVKPKESVPQELREHFRYPEDMFKVQRDLLGRYHVSSAQEFYSQQTFWNVPGDPTQDGGTSTSGNAAKQPPYYVLAQAPGQNTPTFQVTSALASLKRNFMASWVSVSCDPLNYGKFTVLRMPTDGQIDGPNQVQNNFNSTEKVTQQRTLLQNQNVKVTWGNLLTLPIAGGLLYVEPIYIEQKSSTGFPQLAFVLAYFQGKPIGFGPTLKEALDQVFGPGTGDNATKPPDNGKPTTSTPTTTGSTPPGSSELDQAIAELSAAVQKLRAAQQSGNFEELGKALAAIDAATRKYEQAKAKAGTSTPSAPPTTSSVAPSPTPTP